MEQKSYKRRIYLIDRPFQFRFILYNVFVAIIVSLIYYAANQYFFWKLASLGRAAGLPTNHVFFEFIGQQTGLMNRVFFITGLATTTLLFIHGIFMSHKIAGPIYRMRQHLLGIAGGKKPSPVRFRKGDYFPELADAFNAQFKPGEDTSKVA